MAKPNVKTEIKALNEWDKFLEELPFPKKLEVIRIQRQTDFLDWCRENGIENPNTLWAKRYDSLFSPDPTNESQEKPELGRKEDGGHRRRHPGHREPTYEEFQESSKKEAEKSASEWEKNQNPRVAPNKQEAYYAALRKANDNLARDYEHLADKWAKDHNDVFLEFALERKKQEEERKKKEKIPERIQQAQRLGNQRTNTSQTRSDVKSFLRRKSQNLSSSSSRLANRGIARPLTKAPGSIAKTVIPRLISGAMRAGLLFSRIIAGISSIVAASPGIAAIVVVGLVVIFILIFVLLLKNIFPGVANPSNPPIKSPYPGIGYSVYGPPSAEKGQNFTHRVELIYDTREATCSLESITLVDMIPSGATVVEEQTTGNFAKTNETVKWKLSPENTPYSESSIVKFYHFEVGFNSKEGLTAVNGVYIEGCGDLIIPDVKQQPQPGDDSDQTGLYDGADSPPSNNTCGEYAGVMSDLSKSWPEMGENTNFGDPICSYKPERFTQLLERTETKTENIPFWKDIVSLEGAIMTVGNLRDNDGKIIRHTNGPFGKFQMSRSTPPGKKWTEVGPRGDTTWQKQIENAVGYNKNLAQSGNNFGYWGSAMCLCWWPEYRTKSYCKDIVSKGPSSKTGPRAPAGNNCPTNTGLTCNTAVRCENNNASEIGKRGPRQ